MTRYLSIIGLLLAGLPHARTDAADPSASSPSPGGIIVQHCTVEYERSSSAGTPLIGILQECLVKPGDRVKAGQVLGRLQAHDTRAELQLRTAEAESDIGIRLNQARYGRAQARMKTSSILRKDNNISEEEYQIDKLEADTALLALEEAKHHHRLAQLRLHQAEAAMRLREIVSPYDGVVVAIYKQPGEPVNLSDETGYSIFRVVDVDRLLVTGRLDVIDAWRVRVGQPVRVRADIGGADLPIEREEFTGRVVFLDPEVQPETQTCKVVAEVDNRAGLLRAGLQAQMEIRPEPDGEKAAAGSSLPGPGRPEAGLPRVPNQPTTTSGASSPRPGS